MSPPTWLEELDAAVGVDLDLFKPPRRCADPAGLRPDTGVSRLPAPCLRVQARSWSAICSAAAQRLSLSGPCNARSAHPYASGRVGRRSGSPRVTRGVREDRGSELDAGAQGYAAGRGGTASASSRNPSTRCCHSTGSVRRPSVCPAPGTVHTSTASGAARSRRSRCRLTGPEPVAARADGPRFVSSA